MLPSQRRSSEISNSGVQISVELTRLVSELSIDSVSNLDQLNERFNQLRANAEQMSAHLDSTTNQLEELYPNLDETNERLQSNSARRAAHLDNQSRDNSPTLKDQSYETLLKQIYGLPVTLPESLVVNGLTIPFISFERVSELLVSKNEIVNTELNPLLQPYAGYNTPNRILTLYLKNGTTYLAKVLYQTGQIYSPV